MTHTYALLSVSSACFKEIYDKLVAAEYHHSLVRDGVIDMHGIALQFDDVDPKPTTTASRSCSCFR